jgi:excinuclease ABC subunit A
MPWEIDGPGWHTRDRVGRNGEPARWDGRILATVVDKIHELGDFSETNWGERTVVEIAARKKSDGWFFHAITGETWLLKMKFRVHRGTFRNDDLVESLNLKTLNQLAELPIYSNEPRVKVRSAKGPWQEVEIRAYQWDEIDTPAFWQFIERAVQAFDQCVEKVATNIEDLTPWKVLGQKWHFLRKGFPPRKTPEWEPAVLEELYAMLRRIVPNAQYLWNNQQVVRIFLAGESEPWASLFTKRPEALILTLAGPKNAVAFGRIAEIGRDAELDGTRPDRDVLKLKFCTVEELNHGALEKLLHEHASYVAAAVA